MERRNPDIEQPTPGTPGTDVERPHVDRARAQRDEDDRITNQIPSDPNRAEEGPEKLSDLTSKPVAHDPTSEGSKPR